MDPHTYVHGPTHSYQDNDQHEEAVRDWERVLKMERTHENQEALSKAKRLLKLSKRKNYYKILGVEKSASQDEIRKAYRKEALKHHPGQRNKGFLVSQHIGVLG